MFKQRPTYLDAGVLKCPCGQTFVSKSYWDLNMKMQMHNKFCDRLGDPKIKRQPRKAVIVKEAQCMKDERRESH